MAIKFKNEEERMMLIKSFKSTVPELFMSVYYDESVTDIMLNQDGKLFVDGYKGMQCVGTMSFADAMFFIMSISGVLGDEVHGERPVLEGEFPLGGRIEALVPPVVSRPSFAIRKFAKSPYSLDYYVETGTMTAEEKLMIMESVVKRKNMIIAGSTGSGKTTLSNAILSLIPKEDRVLTIEDTNELDLSGVDNWLQMRTSLNVDMVGLLKAAMRLKPDRIVVGEVRDKSAHALLKAWNTGHPGGIATLHADSSLDTLYRLNSLVEEAGVINQQTLISRAVDLVFFIKKIGNKRIIAEICNVEGFKNDEFIVSYIKNVNT
jgi:type IV secretion system protein VirB11